MDPEKDYNLDNLPRSSGYKMLDSFPTFLIEMPALREQKARVQETVL